jgi:hypothetical protein
MQRAWLNRNVNLDLLAEKIEEFFKGNDFDIVTNKTNNGYHLQAKSSPNYLINGQVSIIINGKPEEFSITIDLQRKESRILSFPMLLTTFFGGGYLITQHFKSEESWTELKKDFWQHVNKIITYLSGSARINEK